MFATAHKMVRFLPPRWIAAFSGFCVVITGICALPHSATALPPAQTILYVGTEAPLIEGGPSLAVAVYGWAIGKSKQLGIYAGPSWKFFEEKLNVQVKAGAYIDDSATPLINTELYWEDGNCNLDWFNDIYYPGGVYSWLSGQYWYKGLFFGAMADLQKDSAGTLLNVGPMLGVGHKKLNVGVAPIYIKSSPTGDTDGFGLRVLVNMEFKADSATDEPAAEAEEDVEKAEPGVEAKDEGAKEKADSKDDKKSDKADEKSAEKPESKAPEKTPDKTEKDAAP